MFRHISNTVKSSGVVAGSILLVLANTYGAFAQNPPDEASFQLYPVQQFIPCMAAPGQTPTVKVFVKRGQLNDTMTITLNGFKPGLQFDLFTVQNSPFKADGTVDPRFRNFGLAWYQSDLKPGSTTIKTILLDQIFGFDPEVNLPPTKTFHVGFWFNNPQDAQACGFDVTKPTPFNGENKAGPLAFISKPNPNTGLGPLCVNPNNSTNPPTCNP
jgi:hypothetical protein